MRRAFFERRTVLATLAVAACLAATTSAVPVSASPTPGSSRALTQSLVPLASDVGFESINPARLLDTRAGGRTIDGSYVGSGALGAGGRLDLVVLGRGGVPAYGVDTVVLNVTVNEPTAVGYITVWPNGQAQPNASNLNFVPRQTVPNLVVAKIGSGGIVSFFNSAGQSQLLVDVVAFANSKGMVSVVPARILDTRAGGNTVDGAHARGGALGPATTRQLPVLGRGDVPGAGVDAVLVNVTVNEPTAGGYITVWPSGDSQPNASNLNFVAGKTVPNLVVAKVGVGGAVSLFNSAGNTEFLVDVVGYFPSDAAFTALVPARILDTRPGTSTIDGRAVGDGPLGTDEVGTLTVLDRGGVPASGVGTVILNVTVTNTTANGYLTVWPDGQDQPDASNLNFTPGQTIANLVVARVGLTGEVAIYNSAGNTDLLVDVVGWLPPTDLLRSLTFEIPPGTVGTAYTHNLGSSGGDAPYSWGASPVQPGLGLTAGTGVLAGTPATAGTVSTPISITDSFGRRGDRIVGHTMFPAGSGYTPVSPTEVLAELDPSSNSTRTFQVAGVAGVPTDAEGVVLSVFVASLTGGYTVVWPNGEVMPNSASSSYPVGLDTNLVVVPPGNAGQVNLANYGPTFVVVVEVFGYFPAGSAYQGVNPSRILDSRLTSPIADGAGSTVSPPVPGGTTAALLSVIVSNPTGTGTLTAWSGASVPANPALRWTGAGGVTQEFVLVPLDSGGNITVRPNGASTHVTVDLVGYVM